MAYRRNLMSKWHVRWKKEFWTYMQEAETNKEETIKGYLME